MNASSVCAASFDQLKNIQIADTCQINMMPKSVSADALSIVREDGIGAFILDGTEASITFNGEPVLQLFCE